MSPRGLLRLLVPAPLISTLAIAVSAQAPPATTSGSASDPNVLIIQCIIEMAAKLPEEILITKITQTKEAAGDCGGCGNAGRYGFKTKGN